LKHEKQDKWPVIVTQLAKGKRNHHPKPITKILRAF